MLFMVKTELKGQCPIPPAQWMDAVVKTLDAIAAQKQAGKVVLHGGFVGRPGGILVCDVASNAELQKLLVQLPLWPCVECEITPRLSTEEALQSAKQFQSALQK
jgi:hypothetical protein